MVLDPLAGPLWNSSDDDRQPNRERSHNVAGGGCGTDYVEDRRPTTRRRHCLTVTVLVLLACALTRRSGREYGLRRKSWFCDTNSTCCGADRRSAWPSVASPGVFGTVSSGPWRAGRLENPQPETVIRWHRVGFQISWRWKSRSRGGRPKTPLEIRQLIEYCEPALGCTEGPRRTPHARHRCRANDRSEVHGEATKATAVARMEDLSSQSRRRHRIDGFFCRPHDLLPAAIWIFDSSASPPRDRVARCDRASDCRMDRSPTHGSTRLGTDTTIHHSRSGWGLW